jgi:hypothetical protein
MSTIRRGFAVGAILVTGMLTAAPAMAASESHAAPAVVRPTLTRMHVCAQDLYVRESAAGRAIGTLYQGDTFDVERYSPSGAWAYGMAYGHVNQHGWVEASWLC